jgi:hypothetical protein
MNLATGKKSTELIIVHGIGYVEAGANQRSAQDLADRFWPGSNVTEYHWAEIADELIDSDFFGGKLLEFGRSLRNAAWLGHDESSQSNAVARLFVQISNIAAGLLTAASLLTLILGLLYLLIVADQLYGWQRTDLWNEDTGEGSPLPTELAQMLIGSRASYGFVISAFWGVFYAGVGAVSVCLVSSTLGRGLTGLIEEFRRIFITLIWPPLWLATCLAVFPMKVLIWICLLLFLPMFMSTSQVYQIEFGDPSYFIPALLAGLVFTALLVIFRLIAGMFSYQFKLLEDIFFYLGNKEYREKLLAGLRSQIASKADDMTHIVVAGHSLGSVIAADALNTGCKARSVTLITMGSPITRLFYRFFPSQVPDQHRRIYDFGKSCSNFAWLNAYRPLDWIGSRLGGKAEYFTEQSSGQIKDPFSSHTGYWSDSKVAEILQDEVRGTERANAENLPISRLKETADANKVWKIFPHIPRIPFWSTAVPFALLMASMPVWTIIDDNLIRTNEQQKLIVLRYQYLHKHGIKTNATVFPEKHIITQRSSQGSTYIPTYRVKLEWESGGKKYDQKIRSRLMIDMPKFTERFGNQIDTKFEFRRPITTYESFETPIIFDAKFPKRFALPEFYTPVLTDDGLFPISSIVMPVVKPILVTFFFWAIGAPLFFILCGVTRPEIFLVPTVLVYGVWKLIDD